MGEPKAILKADIDRAPRPRNAIMYIRKTGTNRPPCEKRQRFQRARAAASANLLYNISFRLGERIFISTFADEENNLNFSIL